VTDKITYYAMFDVHSSRARPRTAFRRVESSEGTTDQLFSRDLVWKPSSLLVAAERGDTMFDFTEITEAEADVIVARILAGGPSED
jgi:hypothetical protein